MTDLAPATLQASTAPEVSLLARPERRTILFYSSVMIFVIAFVSPTGLSAVPLSFLLKNKLHLSANGLATFALLAGIPWYFSFIFGAIRDFWNPFGMGDRGYFILFGTIGAVLFLGFAFAGVTQAMLFAASILAGIAFILMFAAWNGLGTMLGQQHAMSGQLSAVWNITGTVALVVGLAAGGVLSDHLETLGAVGAVRTLFLISAALMALIAVLGVWKPPAVFTRLRNERSAHRDLATDLLRLARHWPIYPALMIWLLWNFSPATQTVLQYYLSNTLHATDAQWGAYNAISSVSFVPAYVLFGFLSPRYSLKSLLWWGTLVGVPQVIPLLFAHSANGVLLTAVLIGLMGGVCTAAYFDLLIRACPRGLEGTLMMMSWSIYAFAGNFGNWWGTELYDHYGGFIVCVVATTIVYALILPTLLLVPQRLIASADGQITDE
jgi:MFS family permease